MGQISSRAKDLNADWGAGSRREARFVVSVFAPQLVVLSTCDSRLASVLDHRGGGTPVPGGLQLR